MKFGKRIRILISILRRTHADQLLISYMVFVLADAALIRITEPSIGTYADALWYCYAVVSTAGFGDIVVTGLIPKILSVILTVYSVLVIAIVTGVVVNYFTEIGQREEEDTLAAFMDKLEQLPDLSQDELKTLSGRVTEFRKKNGKIHTGAGKDS